MANPAAMAKPPPKRKSCPHGRRVGQSSHSSTRFPGLVREGMKKRRRAAPHAMPASHPATGLVHFPFAALHACLVAMPPTEHVPQCVSISAPRTIHRTICSACTNATTFSSNDIGPSCARAFCITVASNLSRLSAPP